MFISTSEAQKRLVSDKNRLSRPLDESQPKEHVPAPQIHDDSLPPQTVDEAPDPSYLEDTPSLQEMRAQISAHRQEMIDFTRLDKLINLDPFEGKRRFRMNTEAQEAIGQVAAMTTQQTAADLFGLSQAQTHAYDNGASSSNHVARGEHKQDLKARLDKFRELLAAKAAIRLHETLDTLDEDKLRSVKKATNLSRIAKDMATVMRNVEERLDRNQGDTVHFHVWKPDMKPESSYDVVEASVVRSADGGEDLPKV
jgi:hypothetical protein